MKTINQIAKMTLCKIFARGLEEYESYDEDGNIKGIQDYSIYFSDQTIDFNQKINYKDSRDSDFVWFPNYYIWGLRLGFQKIESLGCVGYKTLSERLINEVRRGFIQEDYRGFIDFSHIIEIDASKEEIIVYKLTDSQFKALRKEKETADLTDIPIFGFLKNIRSV